MNVKIITLLISALSISTAMSATVEDMDHRLDSLFGAHQPYHAFFDRLQTSVAHKDKDRLALMVSYPITVSVKGKKTRIRTASDFKKHYDVIFTPVYSRAITRQKYEDLFARDLGVMVGDGGQLWFSGVCPDSACKTTRVLITGINN